MELVNPINIFSVAGIFGRKFIDQELKNAVSIGVSGRAGGDDCLLWRTRTNRRNQTRKVKTD